MHNRLVHCGCDLLTKKKKKKTFHLQKNTAKETKKY